MPTLADVIGYALHPNAFAGCVTVCPGCFRPELDRFEEVYSGDELGEVYDWTVDDEDPVHCDACGAQIPPGNPLEGEEEDDEMDGYEYEEHGESDYRFESGPDLDGFGLAYSDAYPGL